MKGKYGLIGQHLSHSLSPGIHKLFCDYEYKLYPMEKEEVPRFLGNKNFDGINVTIPYKLEAAKYCDHISREVEKIGSVNTIKVMPDKSLRGFNTDYYGFLYLLKRNGFVIKGKKCLVLGSGGASLTVTTVLTDLGALETVVISRNGADNYENISKHYDAQVIINTTPVGMYPNNLECLIELDCFKNCDTVVDLIYNPVRTKLLLDAKRLNIAHDNGLAMLVAQAKQACEIFTGKKIDEHKIEDGIKEIKKSITNIVLVGMPGVGKTTLSKLLAERLHREVIDTDKQIEEKQATDIETIFKEHGEKFFRALETTEVKEAGKRLSVIISTGGGVVKSDDNYAPLSQNGVIVFLNSDPDRLDMRGRPLSKDRETLRKMYLERFPLYQSFCDVQVEVDRNPEITLARLLEVLNNENFCY
ncbi:MAG: shikimate kinase [bacterium]|nr:shikimate kinase [bacterium]